MAERLNLVKKILEKHLITGRMIPGEEIGIVPDHILQQDATGTMIMLELEALGLDKVKIELAVQYVDHNLLQTDYKNADDHTFLQSAAQRYGYWYSRPGNGISHVVHMEHFGKPSKVLLGSDSHTCSAGAIGMIAIGSGGLDIALAATGEPYYMKMPKVMGIHLKRNLSNWVSAKDVILEILRRLDVHGGRDYILEYHGEGLKNLTAWDRMVIANMGAELGATTSIFPSDEQTRDFLVSMNRPKDWVKLKADKHAQYDEELVLNLEEIVPLVALPGSPGNVVPVKEVAGKKISQVVIGSSANPGLRDFWIVSEILKGRLVPPGISLDVNPSSRQVLQNLIVTNSLNHLVKAGARIHQSGCMGCIGMGQAPGSNNISMRTMPRNFPGRSGTLDDQVYLCSPETAGASALTGKITDPRDLEKLYFDLTYPLFKNLETTEINKTMLIPPSPNVYPELKKGPNIKSFPGLEKLESHLEIPVMLKMGNNISTDEILPAGSKVLPFRSNIEEISKFCYSAIDNEFYEKALEIKKEYGGHLVIGGENYAQGSSREHAALGPRFIGQKIVVAKSFARIGKQNLVNFGIVPLEFSNKEDYDSIGQGDVLRFDNLRSGLENDGMITMINKRNNKKYKLIYQLSQREKDIILSGSVINYLVNQSIYV